MQLIDIIIVLSIIFIVFSCAKCSEIPVGHMKPLGSHRPPETDLIDEMHEWPNPREFWEKYMKPSRAFVVRGAAKTSNGFKAWTDEYLLQNYGDLEVRLEGKTEKSGFLPVGDKGVGRSTLRHFLDSYHHSNTYVVSEMPKPMFKDFSVAPPLTCGTIKDHLVEVDLWMSGGGTESILHKDAFNAINCLINGTKQWKMIEYKYEDKLYKGWEPPHQTGGFSKVKVDKVDMFKYPSISDVKWSLLKINAGDCLFLPKSYYHQVSSSGSSNFAVALLFSRFDHVENLDFSDCDKPLHPTPLSEMDLDWKYPGHGNMSMGNTDTWTYRNGLQLFFGDKKSLTRDEALELGAKKMSEEEKEKKLYNLQHVREKVDMWFDNLVNDSGVITIDQINNLPREKLRELVLLFMDGTDLANTEEHEYGYVSYLDIRDILHEFIEKQKPITKKAFIDTYIKETGGTGKFASELFDKVDNDSDGVMSIAEHNKHLQVALEPYVKWGDSNAERTPSEEYYDYDEKTGQDAKTASATEDEIKEHEEL